LLTQEAVAVEEARFLVLGELVVVVLVEVLELLVLVLMEL
jgi:hypothetical protein